MDITQRNNKKPTVCILMSTYNGEKYLRQQLDSIFAQEDVNVKLIVRDDGSTDYTLDILNEYKDIQLIKGGNIGCEESFKELLYMPNEADYYAFSDQDDVWHPQKIISAIKNLNISGADLSVCNLMLSDANMNLIKPLFSKNDLKRLEFRFKKYGLGNLHGCVQIWTSNLHKIIQSYKPPITFSHDVWVNAIANMISTTYIDPNCYINYRLHENNTSGLAQNIYQRIVKGYKKYIKSGNPTRNELCSQIILGFRDRLNPSDDKFETYKMVSKYRNNFTSKIKLLGSKLINSTDFMHRCLNWICIVLNRY